MSFRISLRTCGIIVGLMSWIGCETQPALSPTNAKTSDSAGATKSAEPTPIEIQLNWKPEAEHGGFYAALVHGYYAEEGLQVTILPGGPGTPLMESVATNRIAFGVDNADKLLRARAEDADVVAVFAPIQDSPRCIMVHEESGIAKLEDLQTTDGVTLAWNDAQPFAKFLSKKFDLSKLQMTKYSGSVGAFLLDKKYAQQAYNISEPFLAKQEGAKPVNLMLSDAGFNTYTSLLLTNSKVIKEQPELIRKVVRAAHRGWMKYLTDAEETNRHIAGLNPEMPIEVLAYGVDELQSMCVTLRKPLVGTGYNEASAFKTIQEGVSQGWIDAEKQLGRMDAERWQTLTKQLEEIQLIDPNSVKPESAFTTEFLPAAK